MNWLQLIFMASQLVEQLIKSDAAKEVIDLARAALQKLVEVHGTDVTSDQLESLRIQIPDWSKG